MTAARPVAASSPTERLWEPAAWWAGITVVVLWVQQVAYRATYQGIARWTDLLPGQFLPFQGRVAWDSGLYLRVAERGYRVDEGLEAGFPAYSLAIRWTTPLFGDPQAAGVALTLVFGLGAALVLWLQSHQPCALLGREKPARQGGRQHRPLRPLQIHTDRLRRPSHEQLITAVAEAHMTEPRSHLRRLPRGAVERHPLRRHRPQPSQQLAQQAATGGIARAAAGGQPLTPTAFLR